MMAKLLIPVLANSIWVSLLNGLLYLVCYLGRKQLSNSFRYWLFVGGMVSFAVPYRYSLSWVKALPLMAAVNIKQPVTNAITESASGGPRSLPEVATPTVMSLPNEDLSVLLPLIWLIGLVTVLTITLVRQSRFASMIDRHSVRCDDPAANELLMQYKASLNLQGTPKLRISRWLRTPLMMGVVDPTIYLPAETYSWQELSFVLHHELIHIKRKDVLWKGIGILALAINWFNPLVYFTYRQMVVLGELSCDELLTQDKSRHQKLAYAELILKTAKGRSSHHTGAALTAPFNGGKRNMKNRMKNVLLTIPPKTKKSLIMLGICLVIGLGSLNFFGKGNTESVSGKPESVTIAVRTDQEIAKELAESFTEVFPTHFVAEDFDGMIIDYDQQGVPTVSDPTPMTGNTVVAISKKDVNGFYSEAVCKSQQLVFQIQRESRIEVLDSSTESKVVKVSYAGKKGYMKKSELRF